VPGKARVFINNVPFAEQEVRKYEAQVLFEERDISPSVWVPTRSLGAALRKGKNTIRIEFEPADSEKPYKAQLSWAMVMDEATESSEGGVPLYQLDEGAFERIKDEDAKMCAEVAIAITFPPRLVVVRSPEGKWEVVY
jgi:hypothetical protein